MASIFTSIINGEVPARFVWKDELCVAFMSINPLTPGHALVVPRVEVDHWLDLEAGVMAHLVHAAQVIGRAQQIVFQPEKVALMIAGLEVRHVHLHLVPIKALHDLDFDRQARDPDPVALDMAASRIRASLRDLGRQEVPEE
jgi:histidine triad (HIT) family protein